MADRNITKRLAGIQDLALGKSTKQQMRQGNEVTINEIDLPIVVTTETEMQQLDINVYHRARIYTGNNYVDYIYDVAATSGIASISGGYWVINDRSRLTHLEYNLNVLGLVANSANNQTTLFNTLLSTIPSGSYITIDSGDYVIHGGLVENKDNLTIQGIGNVNFKHIVESDTGRTNTVKNVEFDTCTSITINNIAFSGEHLNVLLGDNAYQSGLGFLNCVDCAVYNCHSTGVQRGFIDSGCSNTRYFDCSATDTYNGFLATNSSSNIKWTRCISTNSYWGKQFEGVSTPIATGYGFLADNSTDCTGESCESYRSGSDCFRSSTSDSSGCKFVNCVSYQPRRNAFAHRDTLSSNCKLVNCDAFDIGDPSFWNGGAGTYTEPSSTARGYVIEASGAVILGGKIRNSIVQAESGCYEFIYISAAGVDIQGTECYGYVVEGGVNVLVGATQTSLSDIGVEIQILTAEVGIYAYQIYANDCYVRDCNGKGGNDVYLLSGSRIDIRDSYGELPARHGITVTGADVTINGCIMDKAGQVSGAGCGYYINAADCTMGLNISRDRQGSPTMYRALWLAATATGAFTGQLLNRSSVTDLRDDTAGLATRASAVKGKGVAATDITTLLTSLRNSEIIES